MDSVKYIGMDVHKEAISIAVLNFSILSSGGQSGSGDTRVRGRVSADKLGFACFGHLSLSRDPSPPRMTRKSYGPRVPHGTMVAN
jgi:hypothetical protein